MTYSLTCSPSYLRTYLYIFSATHSLTYLLVHPPLSHALTHLLLTYLPSYVLTRLLSCLFVTYSLTSSRFYLIIVTEVLACSDRSWRRSSWSVVSIRLRLLMRRRTSVRTAYRGMASLPPPSRTFLISQEGRLGMAMRVILSDRRRLFIKVL